MSRRGSMMRSEPLKVVFINTQYVKTDARSFKTVVQELTGKNAVVSSDGPFDFAGDCKKDHFISPVNSGGGVTGGSIETTEFDRFFKDLPQVDDLYNLWSQN